jgi:hypothetical protein
MATMKRAPMYMLWYDDDPKVPPAQKIEEAVEAYVASKRWRYRPNVVLVNEADVVALNDVTVRSEAYIRRNNFWVGYEEAPVEQQPHSAEAQKQQPFTAETQRRRA